MRIGYTENALQPTSGLAQAGVQFCITFRGELTNGIPSFSNKQRKRIIKKQNNIWRIIMKKIFLTFIFCAVAVGIFAQEGETVAKEQRNTSFVMFLHGGYCLLPSKMAGLTSTSDDYVKKLSRGASWNAQAYFRHKMLITGLMYSGYTSKGSYIASEIGTSGLTSSDNLLTTYIAPQCGMIIPLAKVFDLSWNGGFGGMWLKNNSTVYGKPRILKGGSVGANLSLRGIFNITKNFGLSLEVMGILASLNKANVDYHDEVVQVNYVPSLKLNQLNFSLGLKISL